MAQQKANISFPGVMEMIKKSKRPLAPIYELVINALEAALQVRDRSEQTRTVVMHLTFSGLLSDSRKLKSIEIFDNGIGFNDENYERFDTLLDKSKGYNNRGSGRVQFLHRFDRVEVKSHFKNNEQYFFRKFESSPSRLLSNHILEIAPDVQTTGSHITLLAPNLKKTEQNLYD